MKKAVDETKAEYTLAESELKIYTSNEEQERIKLEELCTAYETMQKTICERSKSVKTLKNQIPQTTKMLETALQQLNEVREKETKLIQDVRNKRQLLEENKSSMQASKSRGRVLDSLMQQKREGHCNGLYGRLVIKFLLNFFVENISFLFYLGRFRCD